MSDGKAVQTVSMTSVHEEIIREAEETDWTVDPNEEEYNVSSSAADLSSSKDEQMNQGCDKENGEEDVELDPDELECVDEDADDERREKERVKEEHKYTERQTHEGRKHRHSDSKDGVGRRHTYSRHERDGRRVSRYSHNINRRYRSELPRLRKPYDSRCRRVESYVRTNPQHSSRNDALKKNEKTEFDDKDIPFDELEEVDCYDEVGVEDSVSTYTASGTGDSHAGEDDDYDDVCMSRSRDANCTASVVDEDDFPDLCEDIDADAMRRAAAAATDNIVLFHVSSASRSSLPPSSVAEIAPEFSKTALSFRKDHHRYNRATASLSRHVQEDRNGDRREDEARRRHFTERHECRTRGDDRRQEKKRERSDRREHDVSSFHCVSTFRKMPEAADVCRSDDTELISIKGPLAHGWCSADDEQKPSTSLVLQKHTKVRNGENKELVTGPGLLNLEMGSSQLKTEATADSSTAVIAQGMHSKSLTSTPLGKKHGISQQASSTKKDSGAHLSCKEHSSSSRRKTLEGRHQYHHQANGTTAIHGSSTTGKIPSLLDMFIKEPKELQHGSMIPTGISSKAQLDDVKAQLQRRNADMEKDVPRSRSLLDLDIPPPDRKMMRQYAVVLNSLELTRRPSYARSDKRSSEIPGKIPRLLSPRSSDRHERTRQTRSYIHGMRKVFQ